MKKKVSAVVVAGLLGVLGALWGPLSSRVSAQQEEVERVILDRGVGSLEFRGREVRLDYSRTPFGHLVALRTVLSVVGGELKVGPMGQAHELVVADETVRFGPDSQVLTLGEEIIPLSQAPWIGAGGIQVPVDALEKVFGALLGWEFDWSSSRRRLEVGKSVGSDLKVTVDKVHNLGVTTLVMEFPVKPRYRLSRNRDVVDLTFYGSRLVARQTPQLRDPLVRSVRVGSDRIQVFLAPGAEMADPYVLGRSPNVRLVFEITQPSGRGPALTSRPLLPPRNTGGGFRVVLDPAHGGADRGAVGPNGTEEKELTLMFARALRNRLQRRVGARVELTREDDLALDLEHRTAIANQNQADLFLSIHINSAPSGIDAFGAEVYYLNLDSVDQSSQVAARTGSGSSGSSLLLWDMAQARHQSRSRQLARMLQEELNEALSTNRATRAVPARILMGATMPAVMVELGYVSSAGGEGRLLDPVHREDVIDAVVRGVGRYRAAVEEAERRER